MVDDAISRILINDEFHQRLRSRLPRGTTVHDVLGRTWERARDKIPAEGDRVAWLLRVATNIANDDAKAEIRRKRRERVAVDCDFRDEARSHGPSNSPGPQAQSEPAHEERSGGALERRELRRAMVNAVRTARLPRNQRCALWAWLRDRLPTWAAGRGIPAATARVWALRAREAPRPHLVAGGLGPAGT